MFCSPPRVNRIPGGYAPAPGRPQRIDLGLESKYEALSVLSEVTALRLRVAELEKDNEWLKGLLHDAYDDEEWDLSQPPSEHEQPPLTPRHSGPRPHTPFPDSEEPVPILATPIPPPIKLSPADHEQLQRERARQALDSLREPKPTTPPPMASPVALRAAQAQPRSWAQLVGGS